MMRFRLRASDEGFTIVETAMAGILAVIVVVGLAGSMAVGLRQARVNRFQQTATAVVLSEMEAVRGLEWAELAMASVNPAAPLVATSGFQVDGAKAGLASNEVLAVDTAGLVVPMSVRQVDGVAYTIWRYVTMPGFHSRHFMVEITWSIENVSHHQLSATLISRATAEQLVIGGN